MEGDAWRLKAFEGRSSIYQWLKVVAIRFFVQKRDSLIEDKSQEPLNEIKDTPIDVPSQLTAKIDVEYFKSIAEEYGIRKLSAVVKGGQSRQESVRLGLAQVSKKTKFVAIADGARCLITPQQIEQVCREAYKTKAASAATPVTDTVKRADKYRRIIETQDRENLWLAQTPQVFDYTLYHAAAYYALEKQFYATDDNSLVEFINHPVKLIDCGRENIKITTPVDLIFAEAILRNRAAKQAETEEDR